MTRRREPDLRLLCERCGYHLKGLKRADTCPECGTPVAESLPSNRIVEPWHTRATFLTSLHIAPRMLKHPVRYWDTLPLWQDRPEMLIVDGCVLSGAVLIAGIVAASAAVSLLDPSIWSGLIGAAVIAPLPMVIVYITLSAIEMVGLRVVSWRHRWRDGGLRARVVVANAAFAWSVASLLTPFGFAMGAAAGDSLALPGALAGFFLGLLAFETLVYIGMRRLRYANPPGAERELAPTEDQTVTAACAAGP